MQCATRLAVAFYIVNGCLLATGAFYATAAQAKAEETVAREKAGQSLPVGDKDQEKPASPSGAPASKAAAAGSSALPAERAESPAIRESASRPEPEGEDLGAEGEHPLARIGQEMFAVTDLIRARKTAHQTQQVQQRIVDDLTKLIQQSQSNSSSGSGAQSKQPATSQDGSMGENREPMATSAGETEVMNALHRAVWGHLPDRVREQIQSPAREIFLPKYDDVIQQYYRRLAAAKGRQQ